MDLLTDVSIQVAYVDTGAQSAVIGQTETKVYCQGYDARIGEEKRKQSYGLDDHRYMSVGILRSRIPLSDAVSTDVTTDVKYVIFPFC